MMAKYRLTVEDTETGDTASFEMDTDKWIHPVNYEQKWNNWIGGMIYTNLKLIGCDDGQS